MSAAKGFRSMAAFVKAATWDTPVACGALSGIPFLNEKIAKKIVLDPNEEVDLQSGALPGDKSSESYVGSFDTYFRYAGLDRLLAQLVGSDTISTVDAGSTFRHEMLTVNDKEGVFGTLIFNKGNVQIEEYPGCKIVGATITLKPGKAMVTWDVVCSSVNYNTSSGTNNLTSFADVTVPTGNEAVMFQHLQFHVKPISDTTAFDSDDLAYINSLVITIKQAHLQDDYSTRGGTIIDEPTADGKWDIGLKVGWRKFDPAAQPGGNGVLIEAAKTKAQYKARVLLTGPAIGSGTNVNTMAMWFPNIQITDTDSSISGANVSPVSADFRCHRSPADSLPTGFPTGGVTPIAIDIQNSFATGGLAN